MKIKSGYLLKEIAGAFVVVAVGKRAKDFNGMINLNGSAAALWRELEKGSDEDGLTEFLLNNYEVDEKTARENSREFIKKLTDAGVLE